MNQISRPIFDDFSAMDRRLASGERKFDRDLFDLYLDNFQKHTEIDVITEHKSISMLAVETLLLMRAFAMASRGAILEIGAYIGGGSLSIANGARAAGGKTIITVELGGKYDHPTLPSADIIGDWRMNVARFGYSDDINLVVGWANVPLVASQVLDILGTEKFGLVVIDANGMLWDNLYNYRHHLADDCLLIFDDYCSLYEAEENVKFELTRVGVDQGVAAGALVKFGLAPWGTWFGKMGPNFLDYISTAREDEWRRAGWKK